MHHSTKRDAILNTIRSTQSHPSAEWVYSQLKPVYPDLSLATVYRNIAAFVKSGDVRSVGVVDSKERYDGNVLPHSHFICDECDAVIDIGADDGCASIDSDVESLIGGKVTRHELTFHGVCRSCLGKNDMQA